LVYTEIIDEMRGGIMTVGTIATDTSSVGQAQTQQPQATEARREEQQQQQAEVETAQQTATNQPDANSRVGSVINTQV
jgi:membrane protein involved in colicin uptake